MPTFTYSNNASSLLAAAITDTDTTITVSLGDGVKYPTPDAAQSVIFAVTLEDDTGATEVCYCTARSGDNLTVTRGEEGTSPAAWDPGTGPVRVEMRTTAGSQLTLVPMEVPYNAAGAGLRFNDSAGAQKITMVVLDNPASPGTLLFDLLATDSAISLKSTTEFKVNDVVYPLGNAARTEGYKLELDATTNELVWMPRGPQVRDGTNTPVQRRGDIQFVGPILTDDGTSTVVTMPTPTRLVSGNGQLTPHHNLTGSRSSGRTSTWAATTVELHNAAGTDAITVAAPSHTCDLNTTGLGGLDTGSVANDTWYYIYFVSDGTTSNAIGSLSEVAPDLTGEPTYIWYGQIGAVRSRTSDILSFAQTNRTVQIENVTLLSGGTGNGTINPVTAGGCPSHSTEVWLNLGCFTAGPAVASMTIQAGTLSGTAYDITNPTPNSQYNWQQVVLPASPRGAPSLAWGLSAGSGASIDINGYAWD